MFKAFLTSVDCTMLVCSFSLNSFILVMNVVTWIKERTLNVSDQLITGISLSEALYEVLKACGYVFAMPEVNVQADLRVSLVVSLSLVSCRFWFSTWLCVNFCLTIVNLNKGFYISLQKTFSKYLWFLLALCLLVSFLLCYFVAFDAPVELFLNSSLGLINQNVSSSSVPDSEYPWVCQAFIADSFLGFMVSSASLVAIITSLYKHVKKIQSKAEGFKGPNMDVHIRAVRTVSFLLFANLLFLLSILLTLFKGTDRSWRDYIAILTSLCHVINALNAIIGNSRLMQPVAKLCFHLPFQQNT